MFGQFLCYTQSYEPLLNTHQEIDSTISSSYLSVGMEVVVQTTKKPVLYTTPVNIN